MELSISHNADRRRREGDAGTATSATSVRGGPAESSLWGNGRGNLAIRTRHRCRRPSRPLGRLSGRVQRTPWSSRRDPFVRPSGPSGRSVGAGEVDGSRVAAMRRRGSRRRASRPGTRSAALSDPLRAAGRAGPGVRDPDDDVVGPGGPLGELDPVETGQGVRPPATRRRPRSGRGPILRSRSPPEADGRRNAVDLQRSRTRVSHALPGRCLPSSSSLLRTGVSNG